jgi:hypothetical protein
MRKPQLGRRRTYCAASRALKTGLAQVPASFCGAEVLRLCMCSPADRCTACRGDGSQITVEPENAWRRSPAVSWRHTLRDRFPHPRPDRARPHSLHRLVHGQRHGLQNNSSGMCCGVSQNTYHTLKGHEIVFADGSSWTLHRCCFTGLVPGTHPGLQSVRACCMAPTLFYVHCMW